MGGEGGYCRFGMVRQNLFAKYSYLLDFRENQDFGASSQFSKTNNFSWIFIREYEMRKLFFFPTQLYCQRLNQRQIGAYSLPTNVLYKYTHCTVHKCTVYVCSKARLWIRINFLQIRIQLFFSMQIRIQSLQICEILPYEEFSGVVKYEKVIKVQKIWSLSNWL